MSTYSASRRDIFTARSMEGSGATIEVKYPRYHGPLFTTQNSGHGRFPPAANGWGTIHTVPNKAPPLQA
jgi:hypothetical protein